MLQFSPATDRHRVKSATESRQHHQRNILQHIIHIVEKFVSAIGAFTNVFFFHHHHHLLLVFPFAFLMLDGGKLLTADIIIT